MIRSLRYKLLVFFLGFTLMSVGVAALFMQYISEKGKLENTTQALRYSHQLFLKDIIVFEDFLRYETVNPTFFNLEESIYLLKHDQLIQKIEFNLDSVSSAPSAGELKLTKQISSAMVLLNEFKQNSDKMVQLIKDRGFKDFGIIGIMRESIHQLEKYPELDQVKVLMLRRHEKDFLLRGQSMYVEKHERLSKLFITEINNSTLNQTKKKKIINYLTNYATSFAKLAQLEADLGIKQNKGLQYDTRKVGNELQFLFDDIIRDSRDRMSNELDYLSTLYYGYAFVAICFSFFASIVLSKQFTKKLSLLNAHLNSFVKSDFTERLDLDINIRADEVGLFTANYLALRDQIIELIFSFRQKVQERTAEITEQNRQIQLQHNEIANQRDELIATNNQVELQKQDLIANNKAVFDSIRYAKKIQAAILPDQSDLNAIFPHNFIFFRPRDIIGGDFYWSHRIRKTNLDISIIAVADSTGHGVPGALMTMLGYAFMNEIVLREKVYEPANILERLREKIIIALRQNGTKRSTSDGMDIALCVIDNQSNTLKYSGANRPLCFFRKNEMTYIKGDNFGIGKLTGTKKNFQQRELPLEENDTFYLFTDGYADQFGGPLERKFMRKGLKKLLTEVHQFPMTYQRKQIEKTFDAWKKDLKQVDDVLLIGLKVTK